MYAEGCLVYAASRHVIAAFDDEGYGLLMNLRRRPSRNYCPINPTTGDLWCLLENGLEMQSAIATMAQRHRMTTEAFRHDNAAEIDKLRRQGMLTRQWRPPGRASAVAAGATPATARIAATEADADAAPVSYRTAVRAGLLIALILQRLPYELMLYVMRASRHLRPQHPTLDTTRQLVAIATRVHANHAGWNECHEISIGALLGAVIVGRAPGWSLEVTWDPFNLHASLRIADIAIDHAPQRLPNISPSSRSSFLRRPDPVAPAFS
jgi:hypothetical protein